MRSLAFGMAAAAALLVAATAPSFAQRLDVDPGGVSVGVGPDHRGDRYMEGRGERYFHGRNEYYGRGNCRTVSIQKRLPNGSLVTRRSRTCD